MYRMIIDYSAGMPLAGVAAYVEAAAGVLDLPDPPWPVLAPRSVAVFATAAIVLALATHLWRRGLEALGETLDARRV